MCIQIVNNTGKVNLRGPKEMEMLKGPAGYKISSLFWMRNVPENLQEEALRLPFASADAPQFNQGFSRKV